MVKKENRKFKEWRITELPELPLELNNLPNLIPKETKKKRGRPEKIIPAVLNIIKEYPMILTVRQIFYRLVANKILNNSTSGYNSLDQALTRARWEGRIPFHKIIDRTRNFVGGAFYNSFEIKPEGYFNARVEEYESAYSNFENSWEDYSLPYWHNQPYYVELWYEKDALSSIFQEIAQKYYIRSFACRGYPSISSLYEASNYFKMHSHKKIIILYFGDYDMRGIHIPEKIEEQLNRLGCSVTIDRCALNRDQIEKYNLIPDPAKTTDYMARGWIETEGNVSWELDALEPDVLMQITEESIKKYIDVEILNERDRIIEENKKEIRETIKKYLEEEL